MFEKITEKFSRVFNKEKNQEYTSCRHLHGGMTFEFNSVRTCCSNKRGVTFVSDYKGGPIDLKEIAKKRKIVIEDCKKGILPENCKGCVELETKKWDHDGLIDEIYFLHWDHCNCGCVYCLQREHGEFLLTESKKSRHYDVYPIISALYDKKMISKNVHVELIGGDLAMLDETNPLIDLFVSHGVGRMSFHSSAIDFCTGLEKALRETNADFDFALDCGCSETYRKIKQTDSFDKVVANLTRYASCHETAPSRMVSKYILVDGLNDNIEEVERWLQLTKKIGIMNCKIDVNFRRFFSECGHSNPTVPEHYYEIFDYFYRRAKELGLYECCWEFTKQVMECGGTPEGYKNN